MKLVGTLGNVVMKQQEIPHPLAKRHIVVTRPAGQADHLATAITDAGGIAVLFPVLDIQNIEDIQPLLDIAARLDEFDLAIFVSPNAVNKALEVICAQRPWPLRLRVATVGKGSERELASFGIVNVIAPQERFDSEALLELPELADMTGKHVVIFRGEGGRELLGDTLMARGATLEYVACYRRSIPLVDATPLMQLLSHRELDAITITSSEGLRNLFAMFGPVGQTWLQQTPLFVPHARIRAEAVRLGMQRIVQTAPGDDGLLAGMTEYFSLCKS